MDSTLGCNFLTYRALDEPKSEVMYCSIPRVSALKKSPMLSQMRSMSMGFSIAGKWKKARYNAHNSRLAASPVNHVTLNKGIRAQVWSISMLLREDSIDNLFP